MRKVLLTALLVSSLAGPAAACTCLAYDPEDPAHWRQDWQAAEAVVLAEITGQSTEPAVPWFSRRHVLGTDSPLRRRIVLSLRVTHSWRGPLAAGTPIRVAKVDGASCGYERWWASRVHLLYLRRGEPWLAGLCSPSRPVTDPAEAIRQMDAEIARHVGALPLHGSSATPRPALPSR